MVLGFFLEEFLALRPSPFVSYVYLEILLLLLLLQFLFLEFLFVTYTII